MLAILAHTGDPSARWATDGLKARGLGPVELFDADLLAHAERWDHRVGRGGAYLLATLPGGAVLDSREVTATLNRLTHVPPALVSGPAEDRDYAEQELHALWLSWLKALPGPVINPADPRGLGGAIRPGEEWRALAAQAGLPVASREFGPGPQSPDPPGHLPSVTMICLNRQVFGPLPDPRLREACRHLVARARTPLLGVRMVRTGVGWRFADVTLQPDLRAGGAPLLEALAAALS